MHLNALPLGQTRTQPLQARTPNAALTLPKRAHSAAGTPRFSGMSVAFQAQPLQGLPQKMTAHVQEDPCLSFQTQLKENLTATGVRTSPGELELRNTPTHRSHLMTHGEQSIPGMLTQKMSRLKDGSTITLVQTPHLVMGPMETPLLQGLYQGAMEKASIDSRSPSSRLNLLLGLVNYGKRLAETVYPETPDTVLRELLGYVVGLQPETAMEKITAPSSQ